MRRALLRVVVVLTFGCVAVAQAVSSPDDGRARRGESSEKKAAPVALRVDPQASRVYVKVGAEGYGHEHGVLGRLVGGKVTLGGSGELVFDLKSFAVDAPEARQALGMSKPVSAADQQKVTANMLSKDVLDVARYPQAVFRITSCVPREGQDAGEPGQYQLDGQFTLHGATRPLRVQAKLTATDRAGVWRLGGSFAIMQSQFGITPYRALAGLVRVADRLEIWGEVLLTGDRG